MINGEQPTYWYPYDGSVSNEEIINQALDWLDLPIDERPRFITLYFNDANYWGHIYGPEATEMDPVIQGLDSDIGMLMGGLNDRDILENVNIIITSDHGMTSQSRDRMIFLDDYINLDSMMVIDWTTMATIRPNEGLDSIIYSQLSGVHEKMDVYWKEEMPERLHYSNHRRIPPIICMADQGWSISTHEYFDNHPDAYTGGTHGYDPVYKDMQGIFICNGPSFKDGLLVDSFQNIHIYNLIAYVLGVTPTENDGDLNAVISMLEP
ncbi:type I phosphodiesterase / nucleotide pyrophosphatase [bacterium BMS3Abin03]|nr:type I phosphodiesterase / nucleotide pyrophosphatase [bacterium BMS3Abin03]